VLESLFQGFDTFSVIKGDMLKTWHLRNEMPDRIFGNLPYNAAFAIIADLIENNCIPPRMVFTLQKEAARRLVANPGSKDYSAFSVLCASACEARVLFDIGASSFWPQPRVTSSVVLLKPREDPIPADKRQDFSDFVRAGFASRRKTLRNSLRAWTALHFSEINEPEFEASLRNALLKRGLAPDIRAETLTPRQLFDLYQDLIALAQ
jgi:16S rRNA (adenine1518-N6/adenine1519-N6)-dimethyltransferase